MGIVGHANTGAKQPRESVWHEQVVALVELSRMFLAWIYWTKQNTDRAGGGGGGEGSGQVGGYRWTSWTFHSLQRFLLYPNKG